MRLGCRWKLLSVNEIIATLENGGWNYTGIGHTRTPLHPLPSVTQIAPWNEPKGASRRHVSQCVKQLAVLNCVKRTREANKNSMTVNFRVFIECFIIASFVRWVSRQWQLIFQLCNHRRRPNLLANCNSNIAACWIAQTMLSSND